MARCKENSFLNNKILWLHCRMWNPFNRLSLFHILKKFSIVMGLKVRIIFQQKFSVSFINNPLFYQKSRTLFQIPDPPPSICTSIGGSFYVLPRKLFSASRLKLALLLMLPNTSKTCNFHQSIYVTATIYPCIGEFEYRTGIDGSFRLFWSWHIFHINI